MADKAAAQNKIFTMPAGADFLAALAHGLAAESGLKDNPEALADALIYVPNRRSERALAFAIHQAAGGKACLLPSIRALGDLDSDDPPPSAEAAFARLPPALEATERLGALTRMVKRYFDAISPGMPAVACLSAARELARLLDQAALSGEVDWSGLQHLAPNAQLAEHWQQAVKFLQIITAHWPAHLEQATRMDPFVRRAAAAKAMAEHWQDQPPQTPVIIAGSTGATPASRILMQAAMQLPTGRVILPGLDTEVDPATLAQIVETPSHPQFALLRTLKALGLTPGSVALWPGLSACPEQNARRLLLHQALTPAQRTSDWTLKLAALAPHRDAPTFVRQALDGLTLIEASDDVEEAQLAALLMRETLEHETQTAALVTPDASLARQVSALLKRWQVDVPPSAGRPLSQTDAGSFVLLVAAWMADPAHPVHLMAVLNHAICKIDQDLARYLDQYVLRGPRTWTDLAELAKVTSAHER
ncbi:MAG: double-strand break repair protein AddB, partial [Pseudomonadota bacterium]